MSSMFRRTFLLSLAALPLSCNLWPAAVYAYNSPTFCSGPVGYANSTYGLTCANFVSASLTYNGTLPANLTDKTSNTSLQSDIPVSWSLSDGPETWTSANSNFFVAQVDTDSTGNIIGWDFDVFMGSGLTGDEVTLISSTPSAYGEAAVYLPADTPGFWTAVVNYGPGVDVAWASSSSGTPEPSTLALVGIAIIGLRLRKSR
jgi:hypothetical protein